MSRQFTIQQVAAHNQSHPDDTFAAIDGDIYRIAYIPMERCLVNPNAVKDAVSRNVDVSQFFRSGHTEGSTVGLLKSTQGCHIGTIVQAPAGTQQGHPAHPAQNGHHAQTGHQAQNGHQGQNGQQAQNDHHVQNGRRDDDLEDGDMAAQRQRREAARSRRLRRAYNPLRQDPDDADEYPPDAVAMGYLPDLDGRRWRERRMRLSRIIQFADSRALDEDEIDPEFARAFDLDFAREIRYQRHLVGGEARGCTGSFRAARPPPPPSQLRPRVGGRVPGGQRSPPPRDPPDSDADDDDGDDDDAPGAPAVRARQVQTEGRVRQWYPSNSNRTWPGPAPLATPPVTPGNHRVQQTVRPHVQEPPPPPPQHPQQRTPEEEQEIARRNRAQEKAAALQKIRQDESQRLKDLGQHKPKGKQTGAGGKSGPQVEAGNNAPPPERQPSRTQHDARQQQQEQERRRRREAADKRRRENDQQEAQKRDEERNAAEKAARDIETSAQRMRALAEEQERSRTQELDREAEERQQRQDRDKQHFEYGRYRQQLVDGLIRTHGWSPEKADREVEKTHPRNGGPANSQNNNRGTTSTTSTTPKGPKGPTSASKSPGKRGPETTRDGQGPNKKSRQDETQQPKRIQGGPTPPATTGTGSQSGGFDDSDRPYKAGEEPWSTQKNPQPGTGLGTNRSDDEDDYDSPDELAIVDNRGPGSQGGPANPPHPPHPPPSNVPTLPNDPPPPPPPPPVRPTTSSSGTVPKYPNTSYFGNYFPPPGGIPTNTRPVDSVPISMGSQGTTTATPTLGLGLGLGLQPGAQVSADVQNLVNNAFTKRASASPSPGPSGSAQR